MKEYKYEKIQVDDRLLGSGYEDHRAIIDHYAKEGFRYVGYIPMKISSYGATSIIDLIFEREINHNETEKY